MVSEQTVNYDGYSLIRVVKLHTCELAFKEDYNKYKYEHLVQYRETSYTSGGLPPLKLGLELTANVDVTLGSHIGTSNSSGMVWDIYDPSTFNFNFGFDGVVVRTIVLAPVTTNIKKE